MGANDVTRVVGRTTDQIAEERIARLNEALAARERERPVMSAIPAYEDARRARARALSRAFVEREKNRDHEITPMEAIIEANEAAGNNKTVKILKALQLAEAAAGGLTAKPMVKPAVRTGGKPLWSAGHILSGSDFMNATKSGVLIQPSLALSRAGTGFPLPEPYANRHGSGYPDVIIKIPEALIKGNPKAVWSNTDLGSPTIQGVFDLVEQARETGRLEGYHTDPMGGGIHRMNVDVPPVLFSGTPEQVLSTKDGRAAFHSFRDAVIKKLYPSTYQGMNPNIGELGGKTLRILNGTQVTRDVPPWFNESIQTDDRYSSPYGEIKIMDDLPLSDIWKAGNGVILRTPRDGSLDRGRVKEMIQYLKDNDIPFETETPVNPFDDRNLQKGRDDYRGIGDDFTKLVQSINAEMMAASKGGQARKELHAAEGGGDVGEESVPETPAKVSESTPQTQGGPRIVINPSTFRNQKDALCVAFNEGFRLWMEANDFQPQSEPTDRQRRFFSDTAYADDELQLRRTILARVATFDTSVKDPTDDQLSETAQFLDGVLESGWCKNEWEQDCVSRLSEAVKAAIGAEPVEPRAAPLEPAQAEPLEPAGGEEAQALQSGGSTDDEEEDGFALQNSGQSDKVDQAEEADLASREAGQAEGADMQPEAQEQAQEPAADQGAPTVQPEPPDAPRAGETASPDDEPTEGQARRAGAANEKDLQELRRESGRPKLTLASPVDEGSPGSIAYRGPRKGDISQPIVGPDSPGSIAYRGPRKGDISQPIVGSDSPGSIAYSGPRNGDISQPIVGSDSPGSIAYSGPRNGDISQPIVGSDSPGSISGPVLSYAPGSIESPVDDPRRKEERRKRRDRRRRGLL